MSLSSPTIDSVTDKDKAITSTPPSLLRETVQWAIIIGLFGVVVGGVLGYLLVARLSLQDSWAIIKDRALFFGLLGTGLGALSGVIEWWRKSRLAKKEKTKR